MQTTDQIQESSPDPREAARRAARAKPTTEFERLAAAFDRVWKRHDAFTEAGQIFADALTDGFADYLKCPRSAIAFQPEDVDISEVGLKRYIPEQAIKLRKDGWFGFRVTLQLGAPRHVSFPISFRRSGDARWTVKLTRTADQWELSDALENADAAFRAWVDLATAGFDAMQDGFVQAAEQNPGVEVALNPTQD